ncbi:hypothetical protein AUEXF2481DRAFT_337719 [Aureobasidium subglaciale EXF-2481]|uniref:Uncharacterized protein n=1 Tax=Aureobasidium subglaciale (strain EXF-2481) TaxID=1043005 RepID=A0A074Y6D8_AURSE|nr:uncharacterized protein AUEXF2481DRAFT_337719 [Aureobasidium subglaciale EXF-2481]KEQ93338.1 hypothetical protein AUEXF2481DRAFT_337719 [Aureobasidium subglaciale EXF-2481]
MGQNDRRTSGNSSSSQLEPVHVIMHSYIGTSSVLSPSSDRARVVQTASTDHTKTFGQFLFLPSLLSFCRRRWQPLLYVIADDALSQHNHESLSSAVFCDLEISAEKILTLLERVTLNKPIFIGDQATPLLLDQICVHGQLRVRASFIFAKSYVA